MRGLSEGRGAGKAGSDGLTPALEGHGYTTPGGLIELVLRDVPAGVPAILVYDETTSPKMAAFLRGAFVGVGTPLILPGTPGSPGTVTMSATFPVDYSLVDQQVTMHMLLLESTPSAGGGGTGLTGRVVSTGGTSPGRAVLGETSPVFNPGLPHSNGLRMTVVVSD